MRIQQLSNNNYLYEGLDYSSRKTMSLWENAGLQLKEAALTSDQIQALFKEIEAQATAGGDNRTALGMGKDAVSAVNKAWEDLKTKIQDSGPIKAVDQKYDDVVAKIEAGLGGPDNAVNQVIQKYRKFAKEHPIAQGIIYSALIAAAGISGAGLGGAAVLGLLKMTDKLLQGEKFSSAAYSGAKTGAMAYGASKVGDYVKGKMAEPPAAGVAKPSDYDAGPADTSPAAVDTSPAPSADQAADAGKAAAKGTKSSISQQIADRTAGVRAQRDLMNNIADKMGLSGTNHTATFQGGVPVEIDGVPVPKELLSPDQLKNVDAAKALRAAMSGETPIAPTDTGTAANITSKAADVASSAPKGAAMDPDYLQKVVSGEHPRPMISADQVQKALDWQAQNGGQAAQAATNAASSAGKAASGFSKDYLEKVISGEHPRPMISKEKAAALLKSMESVKRSGTVLSEGRVYLVFNRVCKVNDAFISEGRLIEGPMDWAKGLAGKALNKAKTVGHNLTTKVTADKLNSAWQKAGSPTDSEELKAFLTQQGVSAKVVDNVYASLKISSGAAAGGKQGQAPDFEQVKAMILKLPTDRKARLLKYLQKNSGSTAPAEPNRDAGDGRIEPTMA